MSKSTRKLIQTCKLICTILLVLVIGAQFLPYWYGEYTENTSKFLTEEEYLKNQELYAATEAPKTEENKNEANDLGLDLYEEDTTVVHPTLTKYSIAKYVWLFKTNRKNDTIFMPVLVLIFAVASIITYCKNTYSVACSIWGVLAPAVGLYGFLTVDLFKAAAFPNVYLLNVVLHAVTLAVTLGTLILRIVVLLQTIKRERAERKAKSSFANQ